MMNIVFLLFVVAGLVWLLATGRHWSVLIASLLVVLVGVVFGHPFLNFDVGPLPVTIDRVLWAGLLAAALVAWKFRKSGTTHFGRTDLIVILLTALLIVSTVSHDWRYRDNLPMARLLFYNLIPVGLYFVARHCQINVVNLKRFYLILASFGIYLSLTAIFEQQELYVLVFPKFIVDPQFIEFLGRARGPFLNPVSCGLFLITCMMCSAFFWSRANGVNRVLIGTSIVLCIVASFLTLTRSVWLSGIVAGGVLCWFPSRPQSRGALIVVGTLLLVFASLTFSEKIQRFQRDKYVSETAMAESASLRPMLAFVALKMARDKPVFGHGFGQYTAAKKPYHYDDTGNMQLSAILPYMQHNVFLSYLTETGIAGLILLLLLIGTLAWKSWQLWNSRSLALEVRQFGLLGMTIVSGYVINGMFHDVSIIPHIGALLFLTMGITENLFVNRINASVGLTMPDKTPVHDDVGIAA